MQTFLPEPSFFGSAIVLDYRRLGKQRVEAKQILQTLRGESIGWLNHPAVKMWRGYESALAAYGVIVCEIWLARGYRDSLLNYFRSLSRDGYRLPAWFGDPNFHRSHQSNLIRKLPEHYQPLWPDVPDDLPYVWPVE